MAKIKREMPWDNCRYALFPFGKSFPICSYGVDILNLPEPSVKYFYHCYEDGKCRKEEEKQQKENDKIQRSKTMSLTKILNGGKQKTRLNISQIRENPRNFYENENVYKKTVDKESGEDIELIALANSIESKGQLHNAVVYRDTSIDDGKEYTLLSGARRYRAITYLYNNNRSDGGIDVLIEDKPADIMEEMDILVDGNLQRKPDLQKKPELRYQEILQKEMLFDELKAKGEIPKGKGMHKRKFVSIQLGISEGTIENLHKKFDAGNDALSEKKKTKVNKVEEQKNKYQAIANEIQSEVAMACSKVKLTNKELTFKYDSLEDLEHLLELFNIENTELKEFMAQLKEIDEWLKQKK